MVIDTSLILAAGSLGVWNTLWDILVLLAMALLLGSVAARLGQSVIVGYLIAGTLVGPNVLGWISTQAELFSIAELGVALLLFAIGLEFSPRRLKTLGTIVLKTGPLQVVLTAAVGFGVTLACGLSDREAVVIGMIVALSSTACVLRTLTDRTQIDSQHGRTALGILLVQDIAVIPMMLLVSLMGEGGGWASIIGKLATAMLLAAALIALFYALFRYVAPRLMLLPTMRKNRDLPVLLAAIMAAGSAWAAHAVGLSPALGAFTAGALLAVSPFATQIRADLRPLTTLMVTLFFSSIGMFGDPVWLMGNWLIVAAVVLAIIVGKPLIIAVLARSFGQPWRYAIASSLCLAQVGEFSFVLATIAHSNAVGTALISSSTFLALVSATIVTLLLTPYLVAAAPWAGRAGEQFIRRRAAATHTASDGPSGTTAANPALSASEALSVAESGEPGLILIVGFGPAGQCVAEDLMHARQNQIVVVDLNHANIEAARRLGLNAHLGDATHRDILEHAGILQASAVVVTTPDHATSRHLIRLVREVAPGAFLVVRCRYHMLHSELQRAGAHEVVDEEQQVGRRLAAQVRKHVAE
jgi:CPA2 family monovalent cation:H+ antiporter-2